MKPQSRPNAPRLVAQLRRLLGASLPLASLAVPGCGTAPETEVVSMKAAFLAGVALAPALCPDLCNAPDARSCSIESVQPDQGELRLACDVRTVTRSTWILSGTAPAEGGCQRLCNGGGSAGCTIYGVDPAGAVKTACYSGSGRSCGGP